MGRVKKVTTENKMQGKIIDVLCPSCVKPTRHKVLFDIDKSGCEFLEDDDDIDQYSIDWSDEYQMIECQGCETVSFRSHHYFSENDGLEERLYPKRNIESLQIKEFLNTPASIRRIYREVVDAFNFEAQMLCAAGVRAIVEGICADKGVVSGPVVITKADGTTKTESRSNLQGKISGLAQRGILTEAFAGILHEHRFLGNEAVHELKRPPLSELKLAIQIIEHTLESLYEVPEFAAELKAHRSKRTPPVPPVPPVPPAPPSSTGLPAV